MTINDIAQNFDELMVDKKAKGFSIGKGKKLYWYLTPYPNTGKYRCLPIETNKSLGWPRFCYPEQKIVIHFN